MSNPAGIVEMPRAITRDQLIAREVRAEMGRQKPSGITQARVAVEVFGESQQWLARRLNGAVPFSAGELLAIADYLQVDVVQFLSAAKTPSGPTTGLQWAPRGSNPQPTDYKSEGLGRVIDLSQYRRAVGQ